MGAEASQRTVFIAGLLSVLVILLKRIITFIILSSLLQLWDDIKREYQQTKDIIKTKCFILLNFNRDKPWKSRLLHYSSILHILKSHVNCIYNRTNSMYLHLFMCFMGEQLINPGMWMKYITIYLYNVDYLAHVTSNMLTILYISDSF